MLFRKYYNERGEKKALEMGKQLLIEKPNDAEMLYLYANVLWLVYDRGTEAEAYYIKCLKINGNDEKAYIKLLWMYCMLGKYEKAAELSCYMKLEEISILSEQNKDLFSKIIQERKITDVEWEDADEAATWDRPPQ